MYTSKIYTQVNQKSKLQLVLFCDCSWLLMGTELPQSVKGFMNYNQIELGSVVDYNCTHIHSCNLKFNS